MKQGRERGTIMSPRTPHLVEAGQLASGMGWNHQEGQEKKQEIILPQRLREESDSREEKSNVGQLES